MKTIDTITSVFNMLSTYSKHIIFFSFAGLVAIIFVVIIRFEHKHKKDTNGKSLLNAIAPSIFFWLILSLIYLGLEIYFPHFVKIPDVRKSIVTIVVVGVGFSFYRGSILLGDLLKRQFEKSSSFTVDKNVLQGVTSVLKIVVLVFTGIVILKVYNVNINALIAGLGIGGIAVALAAQDTLSNILGCIIIGLDKPFLVGHRIKILDYDGVIENVGIRSTKLRKLDGNLVVIPNKNITNANIENVTGRKGIRQLETISVDPNMDSNKIKKIINNIKDILKNTEYVRNDYSVYFDKIDAISISIYLYYWTYTVDYDLYMITKEKVNYSIYEMLEIENVKYAMPKNEVYIKNKEL